MSLIFQAKLPPDITYWHHARFWRNQLCENALSPAPLTSHLTQTNGSPGAEGVEECWYPRCWAVPALTNCPWALPWFSRALAGEPWSGACHSCYIASSWKSFWCLTGNLLHKDIFLWEQIHLFSFSIVLQQGQGKVESSSTRISFLLPMFVPLCLSGTLIPGLATMLLQQATL